MAVYIETERLIIRPLELSDAAGMFVMDSDPEVHKFLGNKPVEQVEKIEEYIAFIQSQYKEFGTGRLAVIEKATNEFAGWAGHKFMNGPMNGHSNYYDFGYRFAKRFWRQGYATESGRATLDYGIEKLGFRDIYAMTDVGNIGSRKTLEKLGFLYIETFPFDGDPIWIKGQPITWYKWIDPQANTTTI